MNQREIAKATGVSQVAVSLVLRDPATLRVSARKKAQIIKLLKENGSMNRIGRKRTWNLGYVTDPLQDIQSDFFQDSIYGIEQVAADNHYNLILECQRNQELNLLRSHKTDGLIIRSGKAFEHLHTLGTPLPIVLLNCSDDLLSCDMVMPDNRGGMFKIMRHLAGINCRRVGFIGCKPDYSLYSCNYKERKEAIADAAAESGMELYLEELILPVGSPESIQRINAILQKWFDQRSPALDAIVTVNHFYAAVVHRLRPEITVIAGDNKMEKGFEDSDVTMLVQDSFYMGTLAAELLLKRIAKPEQKHLRINCDMELRQPDKKGESNR